MIRFSKRSDASEDDREIRALGESWLCFKIIKFIIVLICLLLIPLNSNLYPIYNDFREAPGPKENRKDMYTADHQEASQKGALIFLDGPADGRVPYNATRLSHLLVMCPCCTTVVIILGMKLGGQALKDPLSKWPNRILSALCLLLAIIVIICSILAILRFLQPVMIMICILATLFLVLEVVDIYLNNKRSRETN